VRPTRLWLLALLLLLSGAVSYLLTRAYYVDVQSPPSLAPLWLLLLALAEAYTASMTRARLSGRAGTRPIDPIFVARLAALAKASSVVGSLATGGYAGFLVKVAQTPGPQARTDTRTAALGVGFGLLLVLAALLLERVCRVKRPPADDVAPPDDA